MILTNELTDPVLVFLFNYSDRAFPLVVADPVKYCNAAWAAVEMKVEPGKTVTNLQHPARTCYVGVKYYGVAGSGRFGPYVVAPTLDIYDDSACFVLTRTPELLWTNRPTPADPNPRLTPEDLSRPLPPASGYVVGVGIADVTDPAAADPLSQLPMQGWAKAGQNTTGIESRLFARAFIIGDPASHSRVVLVVVDIWSCSIALKQEVVRRLQRGNPEMPYRTDNIWIAGTHTHSGPGGYPHYFLYNAMGLGFDPHVFECVVTGIVMAIEKAHADLGPGKVFIKRGEVLKCGRNRSIAAFNRNPQSDKDPFTHRAEGENGTDREMILLKFVKNGGRRGSPDIPVGALSWYAIHPTNRGQTNTMVNGDNKGWASTLFENDARAVIPHARPRFIAAFANASCGDVSGNYDQNARAGKFDPPIDKNREPIYALRMQAAGLAQEKVALQLFTNARTELSGAIETRHQFIDLPARAGASGALGLSMAAGSTEDGHTGFLAEGIRLLAPSDLKTTTLGDVPNLLLTIGTLVAQALTNLSALTSGPLGYVFNALGTPVAAQFPKPILFATGEVKPVPFTPNILPIQILQIGSFALLGIPGEASTVAGLRLKRAVQTGIEPRKLSHIAVGTYANGYSQYITTEEEYGQQDYEGASTLFGPKTLDAYARALNRLANAMATGTHLVDDAMSPDLRGQVLTKKRLTFRNLSAAPVRFRIYEVADTVYALTLFAGADFEVPPGGERAIILPLLLQGTQQVQVVIGPAAVSPLQPPSRRLFPKTSDLVLVPAVGPDAALDYFPTSRKV